MVATIQNVQGPLPKTRTAVKFLHVLLCLLFLFMTVRGSVQEFLVCSPAELVFGDTVHGPLHMVRDGFLANSFKPATNVLDNVVKFRDHLHKAREKSHCALIQSQRKIKKIC